MAKSTVSAKSSTINLHSIEAFCITCEKKHQIQSTLQKNLKIDTCSNCHPFYLGTQKFESKAGRMERFRSLMRKSAAIQKTRQRKELSKVTDASKASERKVKKISSSANV